MTQTQRVEAPPRPWYREPWPWILIGLVSSAVIASVVSGWIAVQNADTLVVKDYYKQGLAVNRVIALDERARALGLSGALRVEGGGVVLNLTARQPDASLKRLHLHIVHPTLEDRDQEVVLDAAPDGVFRGILHPLSPGRWRFLVDDEAHTWRLTRDATLPRATAIHLAPERASVDD